MISISLLPKEYRQHNALKRKQKLMISTFGLLLISLLLGLGFLFTNNAIYKNQLETTIGYQKTLENQVELLNVFEGIYQELENTGRIVGEVKEEITDWQFLFMELSRTLPQGISFTDLNVQGGKGSGEIRIRGRGTSPLIVASFLEDLENIPEIANLYCHFLTTGSGDFDVQFEITMDYIQNLNS